MISYSTGAFARVPNQPSGPRATGAFAAIPDEPHDAPAGPSPRRTERATAAESAKITDAELVNRFKAGEESAFVEIMRRHRAKICTVAQSLLHNHADAEEITQDTFLRAYRNLRGFRGDSSLATWLYRIAFNLARNRYWYFFRRRRHATLSFDCPMADDSGLTLADLISNPEPDPARECAQEEFVELVASAMEKLDPNHREILSLRNVKNLSYAQIAELFGINIGTVKSRIARAREHLRARLAETCPEFAPDAAPSDWFEPSHAPMGLIPESA